MSTDPIASVEPLPVIRVGHIEVDAKQPSWLVRSLWGAQAVGFVGGTPKSFKTWMALELAVAVASGQPCLGRFPVDNPGHVLVYAAEDSTADIKNRVAGIAQARQVDLSRLAVGLITEPSLQLDRPNHQLRLRATLAKVKPRLLVLDPLVRLHRGDENSAADTSALLAFLRGLQREYGVAIVVVHHVRKSAAAGQPGQALRGSGDLHAWADSNLFLLHRKGRLERHAEHRNHPAPSPMGVTLRTKPEHLVVENLADDEGSAEPCELRKRALSAIAAGPISRCGPTRAPRHPQRAPRHPAVEAGGRRHRHTGRRAADRSQGPTVGNHGNGTLGGCRNTAFQQCFHLWMRWRRSRAAGNVTVAASRGMPPYRPRWSGGGCLRSSGSTWQSPGGLGGVLSVIREKRILSLQGLNHIFFIEATFLQDLLPIVNATGTAPLGAQGSTQETSSRVS